MITTAPVRPLPLNTIVKVAGVSFRQDDVRTVVEHDELRIRHDEAHEFDAHACEIATLDGRKLGYVPKELAVRLSEPHPGGVWRAKVEEVLRNETWGLRIRVGPLVTEGRADVGARAAGLRHRGDGTVQAPNGAVAVCPVEAAPPVPAPESSAQVFAKSGRLLGALLSREGTKVHVRTAGGKPATYPASVVTVRGS